MIVDTFKKFDQNGDGKISRDELKRVLKSISQGKSSFDDSAVDAMLGASDTNKDGFISYEEFVSWVTKDVPVDTSADFKPMDDRGGFSMDYRKFLPERFKVDLSERYDVDKGELGAGGFGTVFIARDKEYNDRVVAIKKVAIKQGNKQEMADVQREIAVMKGLDHPNICKLLATFEEGRNMFFVMELCEGGEVFDRIIETGSITEKTVAVIIHQVCSALCHAHGLGIAHRDIKPENVVFCTKDRNDLSIKLIDWGLACATAEGMTKAVGSMTYAAPEVISSQDRKSYTEKCDIWSTGVMTYVMLCGKPPFWGTREQHYKAAKNERYPMNDPPWDKMNPDAKDFVKKLLRAKPASRLDIKDCVAHKWLQDGQKSTGANDEVNLSVFKNLDNFCAQSTFKRMCVTAVARQLDHKHLKDIHQVFRDMDSDGNGVLSSEEIARGLTKLSGSAVDAEKMKQIFKRMDVDGSNSIDYTEFCAAGLDQKTTSQDDVIWAAFKTFDLDNSGYITIENLQKVLNSADTKDVWSADVCKEVGAEIVAKFDKDGDGRISFEDWRGIMEACWSRTKAPDAGGAGTAAGNGAYDLLTKVSALKPADLSAD